MCQKRSIVCLSQIPIQVCDHVVLEWILIVARSNYFSSNVLTGMLYCTEQLIITIFVQKMSPPRSLVSSQTDPALPSASRPTSSGPSSKRNRNSRKATSDSELGWPFLDQQRSLPQFSEQSGSTAAVDDSSTPFDFFLYSSQNQ
jgi:hypothetical protein